MAPMPENLTIPNPTREETDRETRVKFKRSWNHAYGGIDVQRYVENEVADVSAVCAECAIKNGAAEPAEQLELFDPRAPAPVAVKSRSNPVPENKSKR